MKRLTNPMRLAALATAGALVLTACGGTDDEPTAGEDTQTAEESPTEDETTPPAQGGDGTLTIGALLPQTGSLAFLGPPEFAGVELAIKEINEAGGVLGNDVAYEAGDEGGSDPVIAPASADQLLQAGADVIIGTASSGRAMTVIDKVMSSGAVMISPANTSTDFDEGQYAEPDLYFRTSPSDILQGAVLSNLLIQDGRQNVAIMARQDAYGETLASEVAKNLEAAGSNVATTVFYGENQQSFDSQVAEIAGSGADALVLIAFDETTTIIPQLIQGGAGPKDVPTYFVDGNTADYSQSSSTPMEPGTLEGVKGTIPGADSSEGDFRERLATVNPNLDSYAYAAEAYDATTLAALGAVAAGSDSGEAIAGELVGISKEGEKCDNFADCAQLLEDGTDIDYDGISGPVEWGETGSPTAASIGIYQYKADNTIEPVDFISGQI